MNVTNEIKNKEDSLAALMGKILREPLEPFKHSIEGVSKMLQGVKKDLDGIDGKISSNVMDVEDSLKRIRKDLNNVKDEVLPEQARTIQKQFKEISDSGFQKMQEAINVQQQYITNLAAELQIKHDALIGEIHANQEINQCAIAELTQQCAESKEILAESLKKTTILINNSISTQTRTIETSHQMLFDGVDKFSSTVCSRIADVEKNNIKFMEDSQLELNRVLAEQNSELTAKIVAFQAKLKMLIITTGALFVLMLGYIGYEVWSKLS